MIEELVFSKYSVMRLTYPRVGLRRNVQLRPWGISETSWMQSSNNQVSEKIWNILKWPMLFGGIFELAWDSMQEIKRWWSSLKERRQLQIRLLPWVGKYLETLFQPMMSPKDVFVMNQICSWQPSEQQKAPKIKSKR